ncbi:amino acid ABC transporter permease [Acerihabitans sp. KWT182]|uniref:Amino acid ABC transporter permease n=1 Tax=Acerihabitans sp. KWT182 TaxID=3157919 RepID=A0AAU7QBE4_9GAMM
MQNDMFASGITPHDYWMMMEGAWRTLLMTAAASLLATVLGTFLGLLRLSSWRIIRHSIEASTDIMRCVPLLVLVTLIYSGAAILGIPMNVFMAGTLALGIFAAGYVSEIVSESVQAVPINLRKAARGLAMTGIQEFIYVIFPLGVRQGFPSWLGIMLAIVKDTSVVAVIGYIELLRATQNIITRTQDPLPLLTLAAIFYFVICFPLSMAGRYLEGILNKGVTL